MKCWNCGKSIPDAAKACRFCEASIVDPPSAEELELVDGLLDAMDPSLRNAIEAAAADSSTAEEFITRMMVGECPTCGSSDVGDCGDDPAIEHPCIGRCYECGQLWCLDCGKFLDREAKACPHEAMCDACEMDDSCEIFPGDCSIILQWREGKAE